MLFSNFVCNLFYSMSYPYIYVEIVKVIERKYISFEQIISCLGIVLFSSIWNKYGKFLFEHQIKFLILEVIADVILFADVLIRNDLRFYFVLNILIYAIITKNLSCGGVRMRAKVNPTEELREHYDNNSNSISAISTLLGTAVVLIIPIKLNTLFILALIGNTADNFFYLYIYKRIKKLNL